MKKCLTGLLLVLLAILALNCFWLQPRLENLNTAAFSTTYRPDQRQAAQESYRIWHSFSTSLNLLSAAGLAVYLWRLANPQDSTRFVGATSPPFSRTERV